MESESTSPTPGEARRALQILEDERERTRRVMIVRSGDYVAMSIAIAAWLGLTGLFGFGHLVPALASLLIAAGAGLMVRRFKDDNGWWTSGARSSRTLLLMLALIAVLLGAMAAADQLHDHGAPVLVRLALAVAVGCMYYAATRHWIAEARRPAPAP